METHVQIVSKENIKPSSETPHHLKKLKLSYLDQLVPELYVPFILFYEADELRGCNSSNHVQICQQLKQSLSNTLTSFYPLAGRLQDNFIIDCSDEGVDFIEARVQAQLMDFINKEPNMQELKQYLPLDPIASINANERTTLFAVQITFFDCGGVSVGVCCSHKIGDCASIMAFINAWAATCRGEAEISKFSFDLASYFPARDFPPSDLYALSMSNENFKTKRFVFDKEKLAALKQAATSASGSTVNDPSRVELVSAFILKNFVEVAKHDNPKAAKKTFAATHAVNLRARTSPPQFLEYVFGNSVMSALVFSDQPEGVEEFHEVVSKFRRAIRRINNDYIKKAQSGDSYLEDLSKLVSPMMEGELELCLFSSWCRFPVYEVDYGWGNPIWVCATALPSKNCTALLSTKCGEGIEAWVNMDKDSLEMLETQIKLICTNQAL